MKYRTLGSTGLEVSVIGVGTWQFGGEWGKDFTQREIDEILEKNGEYSRIRVKDNGVGIHSIYDPRKSSTLGFHIVESLVGQINGKINIATENGLSVTVSIPL